LDIHGGTVSQHPSTIALIPARMGSSRFPGKPMAPILGRPMIEHVFERVSGHPLIDEVVVATCDAEIFDHISAIGGRAVMTSDRHERASDRCAEALLAVEAELGHQFEIALMVQGDEPMITHQMLSEALEPMAADPSIKVLNLLGRIDTQEEFDDPNSIKVVVDRELRAVYMSRRPIPTRAVPGQDDIFKQVCIIPFRRDFLIEYTELEPTPLEIHESIDMLRVIEHGMHVNMAPTVGFSQAVDTPADLAKVEDLMRRGA
jgi:3-deoxy-manno-octulosonate cytidylyltransferase (CMP-KDO synthetase)